jgi:hypothetical protein
MCEVSLGDTKKSQFSFYSFLVVMGFELSALFLPGKGSTS